MWRASGSCGSLFIFIGTAMGLPLSGHAAPCCSAGANVPTLVTNDDLARVAIIHSYSDTVMDAPAQGIPVLRPDRNSDSAHLTRLAGAYKITEDWQLGASFSFVSRSTKLAGRLHTDEGWGDTDLSLGYEILPEWGYSRWKPRGFVYLQAVLPTGTAIQDASASSPAGARGQGVFQTAAGAVFTKNWGSWDAFLSPELRYLHARSFNNEAGNQTLFGTWTGSVQFGAGRTLGATGLRVALRTQPVFQSPREIEAQGRRSVTSGKLVWNTGADLSWLVGERWVAALAYTDQTLAGPARNTTLERGLAISFQHRWEP